MRKLLSLLLAVVMVFSLAAAAFAATVTPSVSVAQIHAGDDVTVTLSLDETISGVASFEYYLYFNANLFTLKESQKGTAHEKMSIGNLATTKDGKQHYYSISVIDTEASDEGLTITAGTIYTLTFTAKQDLGANQTADFRLESQGVYTPSFTEISVPVSKETVQVTVEPAAPAEPGYTATLGTDVAGVVVDEEVIIPITIGHTDESITGFNAFDMTLTYDNKALEYVGTDDESLTVSAKDGTLRLLRYGATLPVGSQVKLKFKAIKTGEAAVTMSKSLVGVSESAHLRDADAASVVNDKQNVSVGDYTVNLPSEFSGMATVVAGANYTFTARDKNYNYTVSATMGGVPATVKDNGNGSYTIENVTGNLEITTTKVGKTFGVTLNGLTGGETAQYMTDYVATVSQQAGYTYTITATIGGKSYTGFTYVAANGSVTIPGADITGEVVITAQGNAPAPGSYAVTFEGNGAAEAVGNPAVAPNQSYTFTLNKTEGYTYTVTATMGGTGTTVTDNQDGTYTIANVTGALVITIIKESEVTVSVSEYLKLDDKVMFLVKATGTLAEGRAYAYDGNVMFKTTAYSDDGEWVCLVITEGSLTAEAAKAKVTGVSGAQITTLASTLDVNMTQKVDVNDAQLVYDMYNNKYQDFATVNMQKFLNADTNADGKVDVNDAAKIVNSISK